MNIVIYLIQHGAAPDVPTVRGETPLHLAARANQADIIRILIRNGADVNAKARVSPFVARFCLFSHLDFVSYTQQEQQTALHIASRLGNVSIVQILLQNGAAVDSVTRDNYTALHIAAKEGQEEVASILLDHGASVTATTKVCDLKAHESHVHAVLLFLQKGFTPLHLSAKYGNIKVSRLLLAKGAPVDAQGKVIC